MKFPKIIGFMAVLLSCDGVASQESLNVWESLDDVRRFKDSKVSLSYDAFDRIIQNTVDSLRKVDPFLLLSILTMAENCLPEPLKNKISEPLVDLVNSFTSDYRGRELDSSKYYFIKLAQLLILSQTEGGGGYKMIEGFSPEIIAIAQGLLERQCGSLMDLASAIKRGTESIINEYVEEH